jgi:hypothetical protein
MMVLMTYFDAEAAPALTVYWLIYVVALLVLCSTLGAQFYLFSCKGLPWYGVLVAPYMGAMFFILILKLTVVLYSCLP